MLSHQVSIPSDGTQKNDLIGSVQRALHILELLAQHPAGLNAKQVSHQLHLHLSTCYHILNTLIASQYIIKDPDTARFQLSGKMSYPLYHAFSPAQLVKHLTPHVQALQETTHETAYLSLWDGNEIILSSIVESPRSVRVKTLTIGYSEGNHAMALGKAILSYLEPAELTRYLTNRELPAYTANTITDPKELVASLAVFREQGYASDMEEYMPDVHCISTPIFDAKEQIVASLAISLPAMRHRANGQPLVAQVIRGAQAATRTLHILGYARPSNRSNV